MKAVAEGRFPVSQKTLGQPYKTVNQKVDNEERRLTIRRSGLAETTQRGFLMNKNMKTFSKIGGLGLAGVLAFGAGQATAETFSVTTDVQNTLAITIVQDLNLGTLFAASANSSAINSLALAADGTFGTSTPFATGGATGDAPSLISLGGQTAARGSVATGSDFTVTLPAGTQTADLAATADFASAAATAAGVSEVRIGGSGGDPTVARFYLADFVVGDATADANPTQTTNTVRFEPGFSVTTVEFGIGATVYTDGSGVRDAYEAGTYTGSFDVTAAF